MRLARRSVHQLRGVRQIEIDQLPAVVADRVIVTIGLAIVAAGAVAKIDFVNEPGVFQVAQRVVNGCVADPGQAPPCRLKDIAGGRVIGTLLDHLKNRFSLGSQLRLLLGLFHSGFRLILNLRIVKPRINANFRGLPVGDCGVATCVVDDSIYVAFKWWTANAVRGEELLRLGRVVELLNEEVRDRVMWQAAYSRRGRQH